jgi:hypothetical protein
MAWQFCAKRWDSSCSVVTVSALMPQWFVHLSKEETDHVFQDSSGMT